MFEALINVLREKFPLNRVVALTTAIITPIAAGLGGTVTAWLADHLPLIAEQFGQGQITAAFVAGAVLTAGGVVTMAYRWLEGWQKHEKLIHEAVTAITESPPASSDAEPGTPAHDAPDDDMRRALRDKPRGGGVQPVGEGDEFATAGD